MTKSDLLNLWSQWNRVKVSPPYPAVLAETIDQPKTNPTLKSWVHFKAGCMCLERPICASQNSSKTTVSHDGMLHNCIVLLQNSSQFQFLSVMTIFLQIEISLLLYRKKRNHQSKVRGQDNGRSLLWCNGYLQSYPIHWRQNTFVSGDGSEVAPPPPTMSVCGKLFAATDVCRLYTSCSNPDWFQTMVNALNKAGCLVRLSIVRWQIVWLVCLSCLWIVISHATSVGSKHSDQKGQNDPLHTIILLLVLIWTVQDLTVLFIK